MTNNAHLTTAPTGGTLTTGMDLWRTGELQESGLNARRVATLVRAGDLVRLRRGSYIRGSTRAAQKPRVRSRRLIAAHAHGTLTTSGSGFVYSHTPAARLNTGWTSRGGKRRWHWNLMARRSTSTTSPPNRSSTRSGNVKKR